MFRENAQKEANMGIIGHFLTFQRIVKFLTIIIYIL